MRYATQAPGRRQAGGARLKLVAQPERLAALARDPVVPLLRETPAAKEVTDAGPA
jgi:hypothetical protein